MHTDGLKPEPLAVVGSSCRLPGGATSPSNLWTLLQSPRDVRSDLSTAKRFSTRGFYHENGDHHGSTNVKHAYLCEEDYRAFDHDFFSIHRREAEAMDPQQRMLLEAVYEGIEAAGYSMHALRGSQTGVFVGQMTDDYKDLVYRDMDNAPQYTATGASRAITANRISYFFDWHGPSVNLDTACSSSLVALHQAVQTLRSGESTMAVAAGANLILSPDLFVVESKLHMLSPTGRCRMWDAGADGYARGEGVAVVVLKTLQQALADNDHIECIIRETGVNQNGRTPGGLTVPNAVTQAALIRSTYARCGLDPTRVQDRCQYFEAHGTGTAAGDPKEARAIRDTFFPPRKDSDVNEDDKSGQVLYVGSVKTVVGHTEGAAGLVAVLKASLATQHAQIPPNMHFEQLSSAVRPFYYPHLQIPTELQPWPSLAQGTPRRASVNSFGLGGTNAHVIIESWDGGGTTAMPDRDDIRVPGACGPFTLSARSRPALKRAVSELSETLQHSKDNINMGYLAWTLQSRRTEFPFRAAFSAATRQELVRKLDAYDKGDDKVGETIAVSSEFPLRILGVFTGQGAQWPRMGARLFEQSPLFRRSIQKLDDSLSWLPDAPSWSLTDELLVASGDESRVHDAEIAQPLTTALQIALVDLLSASGVTLSAVVGHSSGEITAAYASGYLSASDAIRIAYYRGLQSSLARSPVSGESGSMMAVAMAFNDAKSFCQRSTFSSRISVAASNAPSSVTLSGDSKVILEAKEVLDQQGTFARVLKVNKAYHSHHMLPCAEAYLECLGRCAIQPQRTSVEGDCTWYSSVHGPNGSSIHDPDALRDRYWIDNLTKPVLFFQAVERAAREDDHCFDLALEIGPHPALQGPFTDALRAVTGVDIPYLGLLKRGEDDRVAFSEALGSMWTMFRSPPGMSTVVDWDAFRKALYGQEDRLQQQPRLFRDLPSYSWDHDKPLFFESNRSKAWRTYSRPIHPLLGKATQHGGSSYRDPTTMTWRNTLKLVELDWLRGHQFQNQVVFPAAGYVSMAIDAAGALAEVLEPNVDNPARLVELTDLRLHRAITLDDNLTVGVEMIFIMRVLGLDHVRHVITAEYACYSGDANARPEEADGGDKRGATTTTSLRFSGHATITLVPPSHEDRSQQASPLPSRIAPKLPLNSVDTGRFYLWTSSIGLQYSGDFLIESIQRRRNLSTVVVKQPGDETRTDHDLMHVHPGTLDAAFQGLFAAHNFPGDGRMNAPHLPSAIDRIRVDMTVVGGCSCQQRYNLEDNSSSRLVADCHVRQDSTAIISGDVDLFCAGCERPTMQVEGLAVSRLSKPTSRDDRPLFARTVWDRDLQSCGPELSPDRPTPGYPEGRAKLSEVCDRMAYFYLSHLGSQISQEESQSMAWHFQYLLDWAVNQVVPTVQAGRHTRVRAEWTADTYEVIEAWRNQYIDCVEIQLIHAVGECLPSIMVASCTSATAPASILDTLMEDNKLSRFYLEAAGMWQANQILGSVIGQLANRYPQMHILEIGGGTGAATASALAQLDGHFSSYTFTDISAAFFHDAQAKFATTPGADKIRYTVLDIERDPREAGFEEHSFDLIVASNVLHATRSLAHTIAHCRTLLRPGSFLVLNELTSDTLYGPFIVSGLPGWWLGREGDGRMYSPMVSEQRWDSLLKENGFSGVDHVARDTQDSHTYLNSIMISQATDERVEFLRAPLRSVVAPSFAAQLDHLVIVGGKTGQVVHDTALEMDQLLQPFVRHPTVLHGWNDLEDGASMKTLNPGNNSSSFPIIKPGSAVICLSEGQEDQEGAALWDLSPARLQALQSIFHNASHVFWVTRGCQAEDPRANMMVGIARTIMCESPHLRFLFVDMTDNDTSSPDRRLESNILSEIFLRMIYLDRSEYSGVLWSNETELAVREGGVVYIPRIKPDDLLNRRLASGTRVVEKIVPSAVCIEIALAQDGRLALQEAGTSSPVNRSESKRTMIYFTPRYSSLFAFSPCSRASPLYICLGSTADEPEQMVIAVSHINSSSLELPEDQVMACNIFGETQPIDLLRHIISVVLCESFLANLSGTLWLHDVPIEMAKLVMQMGETKGVEVFLSTSSASSAAAGPHKINLIHPRSTQRALETVVPSDVERLVMMGMDGDNDAGSLQDTLERSGLIEKSKIRYFCQDVGNAKGVSIGFSDDSKMWDIIMKEVSTCILSKPERIELLSGPPSIVIDVDKISSVSGYHEVSTIVSWNHARIITGSVSVRMSPLGAVGRLLFSPRKTYLLVGLAGEVGMSLVEWMIGMGARYFAIASRKPQIDVEVHKHLKRLGVAEIQTWALDVADKQALCQAHAEMVACMPPIAGVANGAMVLRDRPFGKMTAEDFKVVLRPKAQGTQNLDELFYEDRSLDFFVLFASGTSIVGNAGQSNYSAANMFMASLAEQRRRRGVAASLIYLGQLLGVGHVARSLLDSNAGGAVGTVEAQLRRVSSLPLSEADLHAAFAEAVASGRPNSSMDPGIIVGLGDGKEAPWRSIPRFSFWLSHLSGRQSGDSQSTSTDDKKKHATQSHRSFVRQELASVLDTSHADGVSLLEEAFAVQLGVILQTDVSRIDKNAPLVALGIDSLVAVEVRSWFLKEVSVDVPILGMLGGASLTDICRDAVIEFSESKKKEQSVESKSSSEFKAPSSLSGDLIVEGERISDAEDDDVGSTISSQLPASDATSWSPSQLDVPFHTSTAPSSLSPPSPSLEYVRIGDMSSAQARLYFLHQYLEEKSPYTIGYVGKHHGHLCVDRMKKALWDVCTIHESLRSCYYIDKSSHRAVQAVLPRPFPALEQRQIQDESEVWDEVENQRRLVFDIEHGHVIKVTILSLSPVEHHLIFLHHHIALDGVGWFLFLRHLDQAYAGQEELVPPLQQSIDMSTKQRAVDYVRQQECLAFWSKMHQNAHEPLSLFPFSKVKNRQVLKRYEAETFDLELGRGLARRVKQAAAALGVTSFHFYLSVLAVFLRRCLGTHDFSIGIVDANRPDREDVETMGYFLNMLPLRFRLSPDDDGKEEKHFSQLAQESRNMVLEALARRRAPFDAILDHLLVSRAGSHHPLFQVALDYRQGYAAEQQMFGEGTIEWDIKHSITARNPYDIFINVTPASGDRTFIHWTTQRYMYSASDSRLMMTWYTRILDALAREPSTCIARCPVAIAPDLSYAVELGIGKQPSVDIEKMPGWGPGTLIHQVERIANQYPDSIALMDEHGGKLTYSQMRVRIQQIARHLMLVLLDQGMDFGKPATPSAMPVVIGTLIHPMNDYVCCQLAVMQLGFTCLGLDLRNPEERLGVMLSDSRPQVLVCNHETKDQAFRLAAPVSAQLLDLGKIATDTNEQTSSSSSDQIMIENRSELDQCAVILYTSGSTGVPKGVLLSHRNLHSHIKANTALFSIGRDDVILQQTSPGFDFCLDQIFHALANGGRLVVASREGRADAVHLASLILDTGVTITTGCPSEYLALLNYGFPTLRRCQRWRLAVSGGEKLTFQLRKSFQKLRLDGLRFVNVYGPTEVTIACARGLVPYRTDEDLVAQSDYLFPMPGYEILIVDEDMNLVPAGFPGEVCIAGDGVAMGYLNRPEQTRLRFIEAMVGRDMAALSFVTAEEEQSRNATGIDRPTAAAKKIRLYRSGDYGRLLADGSIHLLGRLEGSGQVKIRGMRVELDEIANVIIRESAGALTAAAVSFRSGPADFLVAFIVFDVEFGPEERRAELAQHLKMSLPLAAHMRPNIIIPVEELLTNVNGKLDRAAIDRLPVPAVEGWVGGDRGDGFNILGEAEGAVLTAMELRMKQVWRKVLYGLDSLDGQQLPQEGEASSSSILPAIAINTDSDFFQIGGNSLMALQLRSVIEKTFGVIISLPELFRLRTFASMAVGVETAIRAQTEGPKNNGAAVTGEVRSSLPSIDWAAEVESLFDGLVPLSSTSQQNVAASLPVRETGGIKVLLTGATGFLGSHILRLLAADPRVGEIHCIAIRKRHVVAADTAVTAAEKIVEHSGDLTQPLLGLSEAAFAELADSVHVIIHNGAQVSFLQPYGTLREPNVVATRTLCTLALRRRVPLHFVSTAAVAGVLGGTTVLGPVSIAERYPSELAGEPHLDGYALSKWVGEALLDRVATEHNLPVWVHRAASIMGDGTPELDVMGAVLHHSRILGAVPALNSDVGGIDREGLWVLGAFDFVPIQRVAEDLTAAVMGSVFSSSPSTSVTTSFPTLTMARIIHHCNDNEGKVAPDRLQMYMEKTESRPFGKMPLGDWLNAARAEGLSPLLYQYLTGVLRDGGKLHLPVICL